eukprot:TRINITY_DN74674_c0_g1_i1.p1 TRINITY_DN74674_c0_g1~~TRINITY_DN74674_c0_g1_i1.p1  ORF type:complete len:339 (+),score=80.33 TRINITY_DN74674_c0_g1_i1:134-1150(+)
MNRLRDNRSYWRHSSPIYVLLAWTGWLQLGDGATVFLRAWPRCDCGSAADQPALVQQRTSQPCDCTGMVPASAPAGWVDDAVKQAVLSELRTGQAEIQYTAEAAVQNWVAHIKETHLKKFNETAVPELENILKDQANLTRTRLEEEQRSYKQSVDALEKVKEKDQEANVKALEKSAEEYSQDQANKALLNGAGPALEKAWVEEKATEGVWVEAKEFSYSALKAANETLELARQAEAAVSKVPPEEVATVHKFVKNLIDRASHLTDEAAKASFLSHTAGTVMDSAIGMLRRSVTDARAVQLEAAQAEQLSVANARALSQLHQRAQKVGIVNTQTSTAGR